MSKPMVAVKETTWSTQSGAMECGYHDRQGNGNCRCTTQEHSRYSVCTGGKMERIESEECEPWLHTFFYHGDTSNRNGVGIILREE